MKKRILSVLAVLVMTAALLPLGVSGAKWVETDNGYVYKYDSGKLAPEGWLRLDEGTYYIINNGTRRVGWLRFKDGTQYYFDEDGKMVTGVYTIDKTEYKFSESGKCLGKNIHLIVNKDTMCVHGSEKCRAVKKLKKDSRTVIDVGSDELKDYSKQGYWACTVKGCNEKGTKKSLPKKKK